VSQAPAEHTPGRPQVLALLNASAGSAHEEAVGRAAVGMREVADVELVPTADVGELRAALQVRGDRQLVVLGGDGALHQVVQALYDDGGAGPDGALARAGRIGVVPLGTGNDLARTLGLPTDPREAGRLAVTGVGRRSALLADEDDGVVVNVVHLGAGAEASIRAQPLKRRLGPAAYPLGVLLAGVAVATWHLRVSVDGEVVHEGSDPVLMAAVGVGGTVGGGAPVLPDADPWDDSVDVMVSSASRPLKRLGYAVQLVTGAHVSREDVTVTRARRDVLVEALHRRDTFRTAADGEVAGPFRSRRWTVHAAAFTVSVPR
jgi:diacylglycerol kinase (ATP)